MAYDWSQVESPMDRQRKSFDDLQESARQIVYSGFRKEAQKRQWKEFAQIDAELRAIRLEARKPRWRKVWDRIVTWW